MLREIEACAPKRGTHPSPLVEGMKRDMFRQKWGFSIPSRSAVDSIARFASDRRILDIGCGRGTWSALLMLAGCRVEAYDSFDDGHIREGDCIVQAGVAEGSEAVASRSKVDDVLLLSWPPHWNDLAEDSLKAFRGDRLVYIGEKWGGCTGTDEFFDLLDLQWRLVKKVKLRNFGLINDAVWMYRRQM